MHGNAASTQDCHNYTDIHGLESLPQNGNNHEKITGKMVRSSAKMKASTNVKCFLLNHYLASYVKSTVSILTLKKLDPAQMRDSFWYKHSIGP